MIATTIKVGDAAACSLVLRELVGQESSYSTRRVVYSLEFLQDKKQLASCVAIQRTVTVIHQAVHAGAAVQWHQRHLRI